MNEKVEYVPNKTQGQEHKLPCIKCAGKTAHKVMVSFDERGDQGDNNYSFSWIVEYQIIQCLGCKAISFRKASSNSEEYEQVDEDEWDPHVVEELFPSRIEGRKGIGDEIHYLPPKVMLIYKEAIVALTNHAPILAGLGRRALLETVCKERNATGDTLFKKIDSLVASKVLTPTSATILHKIRTLGNSAAHEVQPHSEKQLGLAMDIIEHLLKDVYILPTQADSEFEHDICP